MLLQHLLDVVHRVGLDGEALCGELALTFQNVSLSAAGYLLSRDGHAPWELAFGHDQPAVSAELKPRDPHAHLLPPQPHLVGLGAPVALALQAWRPDAAHRQAAERVEDVAQEQAVQGSDEVGLRDRGAGLEGGVANLVDSDVGVGDGCGGSAAAVDADAGDPKPDGAGLAAAWACLQQEVALVEDHSPLC